MLEEFLESEIPDVPDEIIRAAGLKMMDTIYDCHKVPREERHQVAEVAKNKIRALLGIVIYAQKIDHAF